jgi:hypothetical protein
MMHKQRYFTNITQHNFHLPIVYSNLTKQQPTAASLIT